MSIYKRIVLAVVAVLTAAGVGAQQSFEGSVNNATSKNGKISAIVVAQKALAVESADEAKAYVVRESGRPRFRCTRDYLEMRSSRCAKICHEKEPRSEVDSCINLCADDFLRDSRYRKYCYRF